MKFEYEINIEMGLTVLEILIQQNVLTIHHAPFQVNTETLCKYKLK